MKSIQTRFQLGGGHRKIPADHTRISIEQDMVQLCKGLIKVEPTKTARFNMVPIISHDNYRNHAYKYYHC